LHFSAFAVRTLFGVFFSILWQNKCFVATDENVLKIDGNTRRQTTEKLKKTLHTLAFYALDKNRQKRVANALIPPKSLLTDLISFLIIKAPSGNLRQFEEENTIKIPQKGSETPKSLQKGAWRAECLPERTATQWMPRADCSFPCAFARSWGRPLWSPEACRIASVSTP
jgi:hypothetical protein